MGKPKNGGKYKPQQWETISDERHWTRLFEEMLTSDAFLALTPEAKLLYFYMKREYKGDLNKIKDTVKFPYTDAVKYIGIRKDTMRRCVIELEKFGFIKTEQVGGLYRATNQYTFLSDWKRINEERAKAIRQEIASTKKKKPFIKS